MRTRMVPALCAVLAIAVGLTAATVGAQTTGTRVTQAEAKAVFQGVERGTSEDLLRIKIMPFAGGLSDGTHYCALDWHTIMVSFVDGPSEAKPDVTRNDVKAEFDATNVDFALDGLRLPTSRTALKPYPSPTTFGLTKAWFVNVGRVMSPDSLSVGQHQLDMTIDDPVNPAFSDGITFFIDAPGNGACLP